MHKSSARHIRVRMPDSDNFSLSGLLEELELEIEDREKSLDQKRTALQTEKSANEPVDAVIPPSTATDDWQFMGLLEGLEGSSTAETSMSRSNRQSLEGMKRETRQTAIQVPRPWPADCQLVAFTSLASDANSAYRSYMEDGSISLHPFEQGSGSSSDRWGFFAVYDGHGGREAVDYCEMRLHEQVALEMKTSSPLDALQTAFQKIDSQLGMYGAWNHGTTATVVLVQATKAGRSLHIAHVGDSRAVLIENIGCCRSLTKDHRPTDPDEAKRVTKGGGIVSGGRVGGDLAISRSLGDHRLKGKGLSCTPDLSTVSVASGHALIVATDGLWDVVSDEDACRIVERSVEQAAGAHKNPPDVSEWLQQHASQELVDEAKRLGSRDNVLVLTLFF